MESLTLVSPSVILPPATTTSTISVSTSRPVLIPLRSHRSLFSGFSSSRKPVSISRRRYFVNCKSIGGGGGGGSDKGDEDGSEEVERALHLDGTIPETSNEFVKRVSSRAYGMRRQLEQTFDSTSYDVLESNPWRGDSKPVYVLTQRENQICTMKTRRTHSDVEKELGLLFSGKFSNKTKQSRPETKFDMLVEDIRDGVLVSTLHESLPYLVIKIASSSSSSSSSPSLSPVSSSCQSHSMNMLLYLVEDIRDGVLVAILNESLPYLVFEDMNEAVRYCDLLQGGGRGCEGVAEIDASSVFDLCRKTRSLAVLFRRGRTPPTPQTLERNLGSRKRSLEDLKDSK